MQKRPGFLVSFVIVILISIVIFVASKQGLLQPVELILQDVFSPVQESVYRGFDTVASFISNSKVRDLQNQNTVLTRKLINQDKLIQDNKALRDQFETTAIKSTNLILAVVVGAPGFLPGFSIPEGYTIDKGQEDGVGIGDAVVYKDNLIGRIIKTTTHLSTVQLISNSASSFTAKTLETDASGVIKGQGGGQLILDNVVLSDNLKIGDIVLSKGSVGINGSGTVPDLIVGKITAISKNPSDLFQRAKVESAVDFTKVDSVFVANFK